MAQKVSFKTLGCKVNQYETGTLRQSFIKNSYEIVEFDKKAEIYIINTCAVTGEAERKSKQMIRKAARLNPRATIVVTGCAVQSNLPEIKGYKNVSLIVGNKDKENIFDIINQIPLAEEGPHIFSCPPEEINDYIESKCISSSSRIRKMIKIQDGCNQFCSYCIIPYLRGRARSRPVKQILSEIDYLAHRNCKEVILLGINLGSYGSDLKSNRTNLADIIRKINSISNIERIRLSSIELPYIDESLIKAFHYFPKLCHHLHIPLQSGDNRILSLMNRKYTSEQYSETINLLKREIPGIAITTDIIAGFPGEDDEAFQNTLNLVKKMGISKMHIFPYSRRRFNLASFLPDKVDEKVTKNRSEQLINLSNELRRNYIFQNLGKEKHILIEFLGKEKNGSFAYGLTDNYIRVYLNGANYEKGQMVKVRIIKANDSYAVGEAIN